jgi:hypothetical protein
MKLLRSRNLLVSSALLSVFASLACGQAPDATSSHESASHSRSALDVDGGSPVVGRPYEEALNQGFGAGYNPLTGRSPTVDCALTDEAARCAGGDCKEKWTFRVEAVVGNQALLDRLHVSSAGRADFGATARLAKTRFAAAANVDAYQVGILVSVRHAVRELSVPSGSRSLNPDYEQLLAEDPEAFAKACGTELPVTLVDGDELFALYPLRSESELGLEWIRAQLEALGGTWEVRVNPNPSNRVEAARERAEWQTYQYGMTAALQSIQQVAHGSGYSLSRIAGKMGATETQRVLPLDQLKATVDSFGNRPSDAQPLILDGTFARYDELFPTLQGSAASFDWSRELAKLDEQSASLVRVEEALASARYVSQNFGLFPHADPAKNQSVRDSLAALETSLKSDVAACIASRAACAGLVAPSTSGLVERLSAFPWVVTLASSFCTAGQACFVGSASSPDFPRGVLYAMDGTTAPGQAGRLSSLTFTRDGVIQASRAFDIPEKYKTYCSPSRPERTCTMVDMNADGSPDLVSAGGATAGTRVYLTVPGAVGPQGVNASTGWGRAGEGAGTSYAQRVADVSGDGFPDVVTFDGKGSAWVALSDGGRFKAPTAWITGFGGTGSTFLVADVDGDRRADLVAIAEDGSSIVALSTASSFAPPFAGGAVGCHVVAACKAPACLPERCEVADVNGDHRADIVAIHRDGRVTAAFGGPAGFQAPKLWSDGFCRSGEPECQLADMNGDGRADLLSFAKSAATAEVRVVYAPGYSPR